MSLSAALDPPFLRTVPSSPSEVLIVSLNDRPSDRGTAVALILWFSFTAASIFAVADLSGGFDGDGIAPLLSDRLFLPSSVPPSHFYPITASIEGAFHFKEGHWSQVLDSLDHIQHLSNQKWMNEPCSYCRTVLFTLGLGPAPHFAKGDS